MDVRQPTIQINLQLAGGELNVFGGGDRLGSPSDKRGFATLLHAVSGKANRGKEATSRAPHSEADDPSAGTKPPLSRSPLRKTGESKEATRRASRSEVDDRPATTKPTVQRGLSHQPNGSIDPEPRASQSEMKNISSTAMSDVPTADVAQESKAAQPEPEDELSTTTSDSNPLLLSLLGAAVAAPLSTAAVTQDLVAVDTSTDQTARLSEVSRVPAIHPRDQSAEETAGLVRPELGFFDDMTGHARTSIAEDAVTPPSPPMSERQPDSTDAVLVVEKPGISRPLTALQGQAVERHDSHQGFPIMERQADVMPQTMVQAGQVAADGQDLAHGAETVTIQPIRQNGEATTAPVDRLSAQQTLDKVEPSLHQKNMQGESPETLTAAALSRPTQTEGSNAEFSGQRKEEGLKWFSRPDVHSSEMLSRMPQPSGSEPLNVGSQPLSYQQGQGGAPANLQATSAPTVPPPAQTLRPSPDVEITQVPATHAVQFDMAPADFGQLRVRVVLSDHTIHTLMTTDRAELGQMLMGQQEQLSTQLSAAGLDVGRFQVQVNQERTNQSGQEWPSQAQGGRSKEQGDPRPQESSPETPVSSQTGTGLLSLFA
ncbi:MAG: flagellar hook-length control protein FliK [Nitrospirota bacterium]|nr:flagellar hook-length control protein FliK [Nitrospirota bacterium]